MKRPQQARNRGAPSLRGLQGRSATGLNGQAAKDEVSAVWRGLDAGKYFWRSGREECFSLDIPFYRTSGQSPGKPTRRSAVAQDYLPDGDFTATIRGVVKSQFPLGRLSAK